MTIASETNKNIYTGNGSTTVFPYTFKIFEDTDLEVILYTIADGTETTLTITTEYTVSGAGDDAGGNVTTVSTYSSDYKIIIRRALDYTQETDYVENDPFPAETHEDALDKLTMLVQQQKEVTDRAIIQDASQSTDLTFPAASAGKIIAWNSGATGLENVDNPATAQAAAEAAQAAAEAAQAAAETAQTNAETAETNAETAETNAAASAASIENTSGTFVDGDLSSGVLTVTHNFALSAPYAVSVAIYDNNNEMIGGVDSVTGSANSVAIDMSSFGTLTGTWEYLVSRF